MKKNIEELREMLVGKEISFIELDNIMGVSGYYSLLNNGVTKYIKEELKAVYSVLGTGLAEVQIFFEITHNNAADEIEESFYLKVIDIEKY